MTEKLLTTGGIMVGAIENMIYEAETVEFDSNDVFLLYTDGMTDALNTKEESFGQERLFELVKQKSHLKAAELMEKIYREVTAFSDGVSQFDDLTLVVVKVD
jgi:sigma-B regulation protein RsbU (phosphoserine phosphatase)